MSNEPIYRQVQRDLEGRANVGKEQYGEHLTSNTKMDGLQYLYEELLDGSNYIRKAMEDRRALLEYVARLRSALANMNAAWLRHVGDDSHGPYVDAVAALAADPCATSPLSSPPQPAPAMSEREKQLEEALRQCLKEIPYCEHEYTTRRGAIWTFCEECGGRWADDEGGVPHPQMPKGMAAALALLEGTKPAPASPWRPIAEAPETGVVFAGMWHLGKWYDVLTNKSRAIEENFTHFFPLPAPPQEGE